MVSKIHPHWKNPYRAKRTDKPSSHAEPNATQAKANPSNEKMSNTNNPDVLLLINNFRDGIKGISSSVQQFEKTMESLTELYQTIDKLGGFKRLKPFITPTILNSGTNKQAPDIGNVYGHLQSFIGMLQKVDFQHINQFLESSIVQGMVNEDRPK